MGESFRPEECLVLYHARSECASTERIDGLLDDSLDWDLVVETALAHGVGPFVLETLRQHPPASIPTRSLKPLEQRSQYLAQRNLRMLQEVASLSEHLRDNGIRAIPYKGPIVAETAYDNVATREFGDLDFLVDRDDIPRIRALLEDHGYQPRYERPSTESLTDAQERAYVRFERDYAFEHESNGFEVELHWRVVSQHFPTDVQLDTVWDRRTTLSVAGTEVPILSPEDRVLILCVHGTRHQWERLQWVCDVAECVRNTDVDWQGVEERAIEHNCERMVYLGLALAADLLDTSIPDEVRARIDDDPAIETLQAHVTDRLFDRTDHWYLDLRTYQSRTLERYRDKARFWAQYLFKPNRSDVETVALPGSFVSLYVFVHWLRIGRASMDRLLNRVPLSDGT